ncbi:MAG: cation transporter [Faecousia sp.]
MKFTIPFTYTACQGCTQKINCEHCENILREKLLTVQEIFFVELQMAKKQLTVNTSLDNDTLIDTLEDLGIFIS